MPAPVNDVSGHRTAHGPGSCRELVADCPQRLVCALDILLAGVRVRVRSNSEELTAALAGHYREFPGDGGPADIDIAVVESDPPSRSLPFQTRDDGAGKEEFLDFPDGRVVRKRRSGLWSVFGRSGNVILGPCRRHLDQVVNSINARFMDRQLQAGACLFHAAGVAMGPVGLAIAGFAGAGKSTLALEIMRHGADFVSNDRLLVGPGDDGLVLTGIPRQPRINPGTALANDRLAPVVLSAAERETYGRLHPDALRRVERKYDAPIDACFGPGKFRLRAGLRALVVLCWRPGGGALRLSWVETASRPDLASAFMKDLGVFFQSGPRPARIEEYRELLGRRPLLVLEGGVDFPAAAAICLDLLRLPAKAGDAR